MKHTLKNLQSSYKKDIKVPGPFLPLAMPRDRYIDLTIGGDIDPVNVLATYSDDRGLWLVSVHGRGVVEDERETTDVFAEMADMAQLAIDHREYRNEVASDLGKEIRDMVQEINTKKADT